MDDSLKEKRLEWILGFPFIKIHLNSNMYSQFALDDYSDTYLFYQTTLEDIDNKNAIL